MLHGSDRFTRLKSIAQKKRSDDVMEMKFLTPTKLEGVKLSLRQTSWVKRKIVRKGESFFDLGFLLIFLGRLISNSSHTLVRSMATLLKRLVGSMSPVSSAVRFYLSDAAIDAKLERIRRYKASPEARNRMAAMQFGEAPGAKQLDRKLLIREILFTFQDILAVTMASTPFAVAFYLAKERQDEAKRAKERRDEAKRAAAAAKCSECRKNSVSPAKCSVCHKDIVSLS